MNTQKPDAVELLPCPFCGGPGYLCQIPSASGGDRFIWIAKCSAEEGCGVEFLGCSRKVDAIKEWNTRDTAERDKYRDACERLIGHYGDADNWVGVAFHGKEMPTKDLFVPCDVGYDFARQVEVEIKGESK